MELVSSLVILPKFKVLNFEKYNRTTDPVAHLRIYCHKMAGYEENKKLLINYFQDSLVRVAIHSYIGLNLIRIQILKDLARAFLD